MEFNCCCVSCCLPASCSQARELLSLATTAASGSDLAVAPPVMRRLSRQPFPKQPGNHLAVVIVLRMHGAQQAPGLHVLGVALHLRLEGQQGLAEQAVLEQQAPFFLALEILHSPTWLGSCSGGPEHQRCAWKCK